MASFVRRLQRLWRGAPAVTAPPPPLQIPDWRRAALALEDGAPLGALTAKLIEEIKLRAARAGAGADWTPPALTDLRVCKRAPDWWGIGDSLLLCGPGAEEKPPEPDLSGAHPRHAVLVFGAGVRIARTHIVGENGMIVVGDHSNLHATTLLANGPSTVIVGANTISTFDAKLNANNGGAILTGEQGLWAAGVRMFCDDMHAIRDLETNRRLNERGGNIIIGPRVWLSEQVQFFGSSRVGGDSVIGAGAFVRGANLPAHAVSIGRPARVVRRGIKWTLADEP